MENKENSEKLKEIYKILIAPTTFFTLISYQVFSKYFSEEYKEILKEIGLELSKPDILIPIFMVIVSLTFLTISIFSFLVGTSRKKPFANATALYFLLLTFSFFGLSKLWALLPSFPFSVALLISLIFFIPLVFSFHLLLKIQKFWKFYILVFFVNLLIVSLIDELLYLQLVIFILVLNILIVYIKYKNYK